MEFRYVNLKAPRKSYKKDKDSGDVQIVSRISFDVLGVDDETLMRLTLLADTGAQVSVDIKAQGLPTE